MDFSTGWKHRGGMGEVVNLRVVRKAKAKARAVEQASVNRAAFGRTKQQKAAQAAEQARREALLDGAAILPDDED